MKLWSCDSCKRVLRQDDGPPPGWIQNLIPGIGPLCSACAPVPSAKDLKKDKPRER